MKILIILLTFSTNIFAVSAFNGLQTFTNNDGTSFSGRLNGDEYLNYITDEKGNIIVHNPSNKNFEYGVITDGKLQPSGVKAQNIVNNPQNNGFFSSSANPTPQIPTINKNKLLQIRQNNINNFRKGF